MFGRWQRPAAKYASFLTINHRYRPASKAPKDAQNKLNLPSWTTVLGPRQSSTAQSQHKLRLSLVYLKKISGLRASCNKVINRLAANDLYIESCIPATSLRYDYSYWEYVPYTVPRGEPRKDVRDTSLIVGPRPGFKSRGNVCGDIQDDESSDKLIWLDSPAANSATDHWQP